MKMMILYVLSSLSLTSTPGPTPSPEKIEWMTWDEMVAAQEQEKRKVFIDVYTDWCGWCKKMDKETFDNEKITEIVVESFYAVKLNAEMKEDITWSGYTFKFVANGRRGYHELAASLLDGKMSYPTVIFLNEDMQILQRIPGYLDVPTFEVILEYLRTEAYKTTDWATYQNNFSSGN
jgi:thioredoxin-related protein